MLENWAGEIVEIAQDSSRDILETETSYTDSKGNVTEKTERRSDNTAVNRDRLRVDTLKWLMCKLRPSVYGDKTLTELTGKDGKDLVPVLNITIKKADGEGSSS